jgi:hypothetical protein
MGISVIDNDREQLNAKRKSGQLLMTSRSPAIRVRKHADGLTPAERVGPNALTTNLATHKTRVDPVRMTYLSAEPRDDLRVFVDCPRIEMALDPVDFYETKTPAMPLKLMLEFAHASEDPRETRNDG